MNKPMRRVWEGVWVVASSSICFAGLVPIAPAPEEVFVLEPTVIAPVAAETFAAQDAVVPTDVPPPIDVALLIETMDDRAAFEPIDTPPQLQRSSPLMESAVDLTAPSLHRSAAIPLPPALWPAAATLGAVALAIRIRQHRRA